jgi:hypothetical protein
LLSGHCLLLLLGESEGGVCTRDHWLSLLLKGLFFNLLYRDLPLLYALLNLILFFLRVFFNESFQGCAAFTLQQQGTGFGGVKQKGGEVGRQLSGQVVGPPNLVEEFKHSFKAQVCAHVSMAERHVALSTPGHGLHCLLAAKLLTNAIPTEAVVAWK